MLTNVPDLAAEEVVARYKALADIERGFRVLKSEIEIAPVYHRLPERIRAHALICFIALVLHRVLRLRLKAAGSTCSPDRLLRSLHQIQRHSVKIAGRTYQGITRPTPEQRELFEEVGIAPPKDPA